MDQEEKNAALFASLKNGNHEAKDKLVLENLPLVRHVASRFDRQVCDTDDLFQEGCIGLLKAVENYDPDRGTKFSTYAVPYILGEIRSFLRRSGNLLKVSRSFHEHCRQLHGKIAELEQKLTRKPRIDELVTVLQIPKEEIVWLLEFQYPMLPLDEEGFTIQVSDITGEEDFATETYLQRLTLVDKIKSLPPRERQIIVLRYIMEKTQEETATILGLSQAHVSRIERKVLQQIKDDINNF
ncbi:MAG: sigma-70 family RNA polymerase sigma factor [Bacillota bacterium]